MDAKTLKNSSILSNEGAAELYVAFRKRVAEKADAVKAVIDAFSRQDPEAFMSPARIRKPSCLPPLPKSVMGPSTPR